jgi:hypothetical protein
VLCQQMQEKLKEKTAEAEQLAPLKIELKEVKRDKIQDKELEDAIEKISNSNKDGSDTLKTYKKNSTFLMRFGIILFFSAILIAGYICQFWLDLRRQLKCLWQYQCGYFE